MVSMALKLVDSGRPAKAKDLVEGVKLCCTYTSAKGNAAAMHRGAARKRVEQREWNSREWVIARDDGDW